MSAATAAKGMGKALDRSRQVLAQKLFKALARHDAQAKGTEQRPHGIEVEQHATFERRGCSFDLGHRKPRRIHRADDCAGANSDDQVGSPPLTFQHAQHAEVRKPARATPR